MYTPPPPPPSPLLSAGVPSQGHTSNLLVSFVNAVVQRRRFDVFFFFSGVFQCVREMNNDYEDVYVDGGLLCNYPIHAFDGMY